MECWFLSLLTNFLNWPFVSRDQSFCDKLSETDGLPETDYELAKYFILNQTF